MTKAPIFTVEFVYTDESTPREVHTRTVRAADAEDAKTFVVMVAAMIGDRVMTTGVYTQSTQTAY